MRSRTFACILAFVLLTASGCSVKKLAVNSFADALGSGAGTSFTSESDLTLVEGALPFSLKAMEGLLAEVPDNRGLCLSLARAYMLYAYAFVDLRADEIKDADFHAYQELKGRARNLYFRAYDYARQGLLLESAFFRADFEKNGVAALEQLHSKTAVPFLYWSGVSLAKWITLAKTDPAAAVRLPEAAAYMQRALALDPDYDLGSIHEFFISYEARGAIMGGDMKKADEHFEQARALAAGRKLSPVLTYVEACSIPEQNRQEFEKYLAEAAAYDVDKYPEYRLINTIMKKRAAWLLDRKDDFFLGD